jgi:ABC-2 type transport system ATP-binding protein
MSIVETRNLSKIFDGRKAVNNVNLTIEEGELFGLLGPNGAGKTTTVAMLSTILPPSNGDAKIDGYDIAHQPKQVRQIIGVVTQEFGLYEDLTAAENLSYFGKLHGVESKKLHQQINRLLRLVQLKDRANDRIKTFSDGMKRRLNLAVALVHRPKVLFLDEPTTGFDPQARLVAWKLIKKLQADGITILLTTHHMDEADYLCDRVAIMDKGKIIAIDSPDKLKHSLGELEAIEIKTIKPPQKLVKKLLKLRSVKKVIHTSEGLRVLTPMADTVLSQVVKSAMDAGVRIDSLNVTQPTLEDVFIKLTGRTLRD